MFPPHTHSGPNSQRGASFYWCPWRRALGSGSGVVGVGFPVERGGQGEGVGREGVGRVGGGWGQAKEPASQCARVCQNYLLAIYPLVRTQ